MQKLTTKKLITAMIVLLIILLIGLHIHQRTHFNKNVSINNIPVGGLNVSQAYQKVRKTNRQSKIYVNNKLIYKGKVKSSGFSSKDRSNIVKAFHRQYTFLPSYKRENLLVEPEQLDKSEVLEINNSLTAHIKSLNKSRKPSHNAYAIYRNRRVTVIPEVRGNQYGYKDLTQTVNKEYVNGTIYLKPEIIRPISSHSQTVQNEKAKLTKLNHKTVTYRVQNKDYKFKTSDIISQATYQNGKYHFDTNPVKQRIDNINKKQATLGKKYQFTTPSGKKIETTNKGTYGWKISAKQAGQTLAYAIVNNRKTVNALNDTYGKGYSHLGTGYSVTSNHGIGNTYVAVSIAKQHAWFYRHGKCILSTNIVSGSDDDKNRTPKGVWYIMYQQSPSVLHGNNDDGSKYSSAVQYWSPFTLSGCGFHDASWRHDWSKKAYKETGGGSHGCINMKPSNAGAGYHALSKGEPVIIY